MSDIDRILAELEKMLEERHTPESALFSSRTFSDQPLIERGRDLRDRQERLRQYRQARERKSELQDRMQQRSDERAERRQQAAEQRQAERQRRQAEAERTEPWPQAKAAHSSQPPQAQQTTLWSDEYDRTLRGVSEPKPQPARPASSRSPRGGTAASSRDATPSWRRSLPEPLRKLRQLEAEIAYVPSLAYRTNASAKLFFEQARVAEDYEDDFVYEGNFFKYYPTYASMNNDQLRGYFTWRTKVRGGVVECAPLSFAFVYVYELLCGIGTTPGEQGLADLHRFGAAFCKASPYDGNQLMRYLRNWTHDYAIYHGLPSRLEPSLEKGADEALVTLIAAEHALLNAAGLEPKTPNAAVAGKRPSNAELLGALSSAATYRLDHARLAKDEPELLAQVTADVFEALVMHCARRRKTDFVEGMYGFSYAVPHTMYASAVFYEPTPHPDCTVAVSPLESYVCRDGRWYHRLALEVTDRNSELGRCLHGIDYELRRQLDYAYPLKQRSVPKYVERMIQKAVAARLKERAQAAEAKRLEEEARRLAEEEAEKRRIKIDRSKLGGIRAAAAQTREALLTDEERGLEPTAVVPAIDAAASLAPDTLASPTADEANSHAGGATKVPATGMTGAPAASAAGSPTVDAMGVPAAGVTGVSTTHAAGTPTIGSMGVPAASAAGSPTTGASGVTPAASPTACAAVVTYGLTDLELRVLSGLVAHTPVSALLGPGDPFVSVVADSINEKLFDLVGDTVIEFDGDEPAVIEDYLDDIREVL